MTSNVGAHILQKNSSLGFSAGILDDDFDKTRDKIMDEAKSFKPEFLNRLTELYFPPACQKEYECYR